MPDAKTQGMTSGQKTEWDLVICPKRGWFDLHLADLGRYRDLTMIFVWRDFVAQYKQTILGPIWYLLQPLFSTIIFTIVFGKVAKISTDSLPPFLFYMAGLTGWHYFSECLTRTSGTFISNASLFGKVYFPRLCVPVSMVISALIKFGIQFAFFLGFLIFFMISDANVRPNIWVLIMPYLLLLMAGLGLGSGIIVSSLTTKYRDLQVLVGFGVQLLMYATPIIYPVSAIPEKYRFIILANPMTPIIETFRYAFLGAGSFNPVYLVYSTISTVVILFIGILIFNQVERTFMDTV
jgi:lipopolysaccharide transport system permease protein